MNYLKYIELAAENLQFFLWYRDYAKRFDELPDKEKALSPTWVDDGTDADAQPRPKRVSPETNAIFQGTDLLATPSRQEESAAANVRYVKTAGLIPNITFHFGLLVGWPLRMLDIRWCPSVFHLLSRTMLAAHSSESVALSIVSKKAFKLNR